MKAASVNPPAEGGRTQDAATRRAPVTRRGLPSPAAPVAGEGPSSSRPEGSPAPLQGAASTSPLDRGRAVAGTEAGSGRVGGTRDAAESPLPAGQAAIAAAMSEDRGPGSLDAHVRKLIKDLGLRAYHTHDARRSPAGFPDWVITGKRTIYRELKREGKNPTEAQQDWLDALAAALDDAAVWRPSDLLSGRIQAELVDISWMGGM